MICPVDFRIRPGFELQSEENWVNEMYRELEIDLAMFPLDGNPS